MTLPDGVDVSVIVPVRNAPDLGVLLRALERQTLPGHRFEVVIVDDGSAEPPNWASTEDDHVRVITQPPSNSYAARNRGVAASTGKALAFCDADCVPEPDWLEKGLEYLSGADLVAGRVRFVLPPRITLWTLIDIDAGKNQKRTVPMGFGDTANLFVRRDVFGRLKGFQDCLPSGGDYDFVQRAVLGGAQLVYGPDAVVWHPTRDTAADYLRTDWFRSRAHAERLTLNGHRVEAYKLRSWVPLVQPIRARQRGDMPMTLATPWHAENGVHPTLSQRILSLPLLYVVLPYWRNSAHLAGARAARQREKR